MDAPKSVSVDGYVGLKVHCVAQKPRFGCGNVTYQTKELVLAKQNFPTTINE